MKIKMKTTAAGPEATFQAEHSYEVGTQISEAQANAFVEGRYAVNLDEDGKEMAVDKRVKETATVKKAEGKK